jgi:hypothetical protein
MIVHLRTKVETVFGVLDDNGNLVQEMPLKPVDAGVLSPQRMAEIAQQLLLTWQRLRQEEAVAQAGQAVVRQQAAPATNGEQAAAEKVQA